MEKAKTKARRLNKILMNKNCHKQERKSISRGKVGTQSHVSTHQRTETTPNAIFVTFTEKELHIIFEEVRKD